MKRTLRTFGIRRFCLRLRVRTALAPKYLNNVIEQDYRFIKRRTRRMLGFKLFSTAWRTLCGIEMMHALRKGQARWMPKGDVVGQTQLIHHVFGVVRSSEDR